MTLGVWYWSTMRKGVRFEVERVEVGVSGFRRKIIIHWH